MNTSLRLLHAFLWNFTTAVMPTPAKEVLWIRCPWSEWLVLNSGCSFSFWQAFPNNFRWSTGVFPLNLARSTPCFTEAAKQNFEWGAWDKKYRILHASPRHFTRVLKRSCVDVILGKKWGPQALSPLSQLRGLCLKRRHCHKNRERLSDCLLPR